MKSTAVCTARLVITILCLILPFPHPSAALTVNQVKSLPLSDLKKQVFGEVGAVIADVDRSTTGADPSKPDRYIAFYTHARLINTFSLCKAQKLHVFFDETGVPHHIAMDEIYGDAGQLKADPPLEPRYGLHDEFDRQDKLCAAVTDVHKFFFATTAKRAVLSALAVKLVSDSYKPGRTPYFAFSCKLAHGDCSTGKARDMILSQIKVDNISAAGPMDCKTGLVPRKEDFYPKGCFYITFRMAPATANHLVIETDYGPDSALRVKSAKFSESTRGR